jgi:hypothetical protein
MRKACRPLYRNLSRSTSAPSISAGEGADGYQLSKPCGRRIGRTSTVGMLLEDRCYLGYITSVTYPEVSLTEPHTA